MSQPRPPFDGAGAREIRESSLAGADLRGYGRIPIAFEVRSVLECVPVDGGLGGLTLVERPVSPPYVKDYDAIAGEGPERWRERFDTARWRVLVAWGDGRAVGGAALAFDTPGVDLLEGRRDRVVLWDLRVDPAWRGRGVGTALFRAALAWGRERECAELIVETQNVNVAACRFYARQGCVLRSIDRHAYPSLPHEAQLLWRLDLAEGADPDGALETRGGAAA